MECWVTGGCWGVFSPSLHPSLLLSVPRPSLMLSLPFSVTSPSSPWRLSGKHWLSWRLSDCFPSSVAPCWVLTGSINRKGKITRWHTYQPFSTLSGSPCILVYSVLSRQRLQSKYFNKSVCFNLTHNFFTFVCLSYRSYIWINLHVSTSFILNHLWVTWYHKRYDENIASSVLVKSALVLDWRFGMRGN